MSSKNTPETSGNLYSYCISRRAIQSVYYKRTITEQIHTAAIIIDDDDDDNNNINNNNKS
jgi:hypothetical protein